MTDRRFGTWNKFGTSNTFGASSLNANLLWGVEVDWDGDGVFSGSNEARYMTSIRGSRGRQRYITQDGHGFEKLQKGVYYITLQNETGRYDAWNTSSELYPNVNYGKDVRITVKDVSTGTVYPVFYGIIEDIQPYIDPYSMEAQVFVTVVDGWGFLRNYNASYPIQENITPGAAIGYVLDNIGWLSRWGRDLDAGSDTIRYWWADGDKTAGSVIEDIAESFVGYFFINADGKATFRTRTNVGASIEDLTQDVLLKDISLPQPWENSRNVTRIKAHPRTAADSGVIYQLLGNTPSIDNGNSLNLFGNYVYSNQPVPAINIIDPVASTDYTMNTQPDGSGVDKTADCTVTITDFGDRAKFVITNNAGATVYITKLQLRGEALYEPNVSDIIYPSTLPGTPRQFILDIPWQQDVNVAADFSNVIGPFLAASHPFPIVQLEGRPALQFAPDLFDIITLTSEKYGIANESFRVAYIENESIGEGCQGVRTKFYLEAYVSADEYWVWDTNSVFDSSTIFGA